MTVLLLMDSFKGSLSSVECGNAAAEGIKAAFPESKTKVLPIADGGEGTLDALLQGIGGQEVPLFATGPLGKKIPCRYGILPDGTAVIEMASVAGLPLLSKEERNPMLTTTFGVGEMILDALNKGCRRFFIGIGGSSTNDGGVGMLTALGFEFLDEHSIPIPPGGKGLASLSSICKEKADPRLSECIFYIACDVDNPLLGENGCSAVYGPQKGATKAMVRELDCSLAKYARLTKKLFPKADENKAGAGAAGGLGFAFLSYLNGTLQNGTPLVLKVIGAEKEIEKADIVVTGEGRLDHQSVMGKAPAGVARTAKEKGKTVIAFSGCIGKGAKALNDAGVDAYFAICKGAAALEDLMAKETAYQNLKDTAEQAFRLIRAAKKI
ncbi:MAG: glycerate kinase [Clostridia bacterium]|nr:glycerate kinase [Clostridia bacterium]